LGVQDRRIARGEARVHSEILSHKKKKERKEKKK
jgi:hypothetical protein